ASVEQSMSRAAKALLATLDPPQVGKVKFAFNAEERFNWHYIPRTRLGLPFKEMNERQRDAAFALIKVGLSQKGFTKPEPIRRFEPILKAMENGRINRDSDLYFVTIFGDPDQATWGWR